MAYLSSDFAICIEGWIPSEYGSIEERETVAELSMRLGDRYLTEVEDARAATVRQTVRVSAFALAKWLLDGWWRLRYEPGLINGPDSLDWHLTHVISAIGSGFVWPPFSIVGEGDFYIVKSLPIQSAVRNLSPIRYLNTIKPTLVRADAFEAAIFEFVEAAISRLNGRRIQRSVIHELYNVIRREREDNSVSTLRQREALLGFDPDDAPDELFQLLDEKAERVGAFAVDEIAAAVLADSREADLAATFARISDSVKRAAVCGPSRYHDLFRFKTVDLKRTVPNRPARRGYVAARRFRRAFGLGSEPISNEALAASLLFRQMFLAARRQQTYR